MSNFVRSHVTHMSSFTGLLLWQLFYCAPFFNGIVSVDEKMAQIELSYDITAALSKAPLC